MNKLRIYLTAAFGMFLMVALTGCFDEPGTEILWDESLVEINEATTAAGSTISRAYAQQPDGVGTPTSVQVNLASAALSRPVTVGFEVSGSAIEGVHYNLLTSGNSVTIPAGEHFAYIEYEVLTYNFGTDEQQTITFTLTSATDPAEVSANYSTVTINTQKECSYDIATFVGSYDCLEPNYGNYDVSFTQVGQDSVQIDNFWDFGGNPIYVFDASGGVTLPEQQTVMGGATYTVAGSGSYDACTGVFEVDYTVVRADGSTADDNTHTFTPN